MIWGGAPEEIEKKNLGGPSPGKINLKRPSPGKNKSQNAFSKIKKSVH